MGTRNEKGVSPFILVNGGNGLGDQAVAGGGGPMWIWSHSIFFCYSLACTVQLAIALADYSFP